MDRHPILRENPAGEPGLDPRPSDLFRVQIIDNDHNTYEEVMEVCVLALGVDRPEAFRIALSVDNNGSADVLLAPRAEAERVANVIRGIGIEVRVLPG